MEHAFPDYFALRTVVLSSCFFLLHISSSHMLEMQHFDNSFCHKWQMVIKDRCGQLHASIRTAEEMDILLGLWLGRTGPWSTKFEQGSKGWQDQISNKNLSLADRRWGLDCSILSLICALWRTLKVLHWTGEILCYSGCQATIPQCKQADDAITKPDNRRRSYSPVSLMNIDTNFQQNNSKSDLSIPKTVYLTQVKTG